jgi:predicted nucleic acid-binding Zn ribbon protein
MVTYGYRCEHGHDTELQLRMGKAPARVDCVRCGEPALRVHQLRGIGFKGSGFYATDYPRGRSVSGS